MRLRRASILNAGLLPPTNVTAEVSGSDIIVSWTAANFVDGYHVYQQIDGGTWTKLNATATTGLTYTLTPTEPGEYNFYVTSVRGTKESAPSAETLTTETMMETVYTDTLSLRISAVDGMAFIDSSDEEVYASDFSSDVSEVSFFPLDTTSTWIHDVDHGVVAVTGTGSLNYAPYLQKNSVLSLFEADGTRVTLSFSYTVNSGTCRIGTRIAGVDSGYSTTELTGSGTHTVTESYDLSNAARANMNIFFDGRNTFNISIHSITVTKHPTLAIAQDYTDGNHLIEIEDSAGKVLSGVLKTQGSGETLGSELVTNGDFSSATGWIGNLSGGWEITGGNAIHTAGAGGTLYQGASLQKSLLKAISVISAISTASIVFQGTLVATIHTTTGTKTDYKTQAGGTVDVVGLYCGAPHTATVDSVSFKQVLTPSTNGATLVNEIFGSTENLVSVDDGFVYNEASYTVRVKKILPTV